MAEGEKRKFRYICNSVYCDTLCGIVEVALQTNLVNMVLPINCNALLKCFLADNSILIEFLKFEICRRYFSNSEHLTNAYLR